MAQRNVAPLSRNYVKGEVHRVAHQSTVQRFVDFVHQEPYPRLWPYDSGDLNGIRDTIYLFLFQRKSKMGKNELASRVSNWYKGKSKSLKHNLKVISKEMFGLVPHVIDVGTIDEWNENARDITYGQKKVTIHLKADSADFRLPGTFPLSRWPFDFRKSFSYSVIKVAKLIAPRKMIGHTRRIPLRHASCSSPRLAACMLDT